RPGMTNQDVTDLQRDGLHTNLAGLDRPKRVHPCHAMGAWRNFDRAVLTRDPDQAKTDNNYIRGESQVRHFRKEWTLIVHVHRLIFRTEQRHITAPLISDDQVVHEATHDTQHVRIEEELRRETRRLERHRKKMAMWAAVRGLAAVEIGEEARPERVSARVNEMRCEMVSQDAGAPVPDLADRPLN